MNGGRAGGIRARGSSANERVGVGAAATILCSIPLYCCNSSAMRAAGFQKLFHTIEKRPPPCSVVIVSLYAQDSNWRRLWSKGLVGKVAKLAGRCRRLIILSPRPHRRPFDGFVVRGGCWMMNARAERREGCIERAQR
jgi:hypothetical protein